MTAQRLEITTPRLTLVATTLEHICAEIDDRTRSRNSSAQRFRPTGRLRSTTRIRCAGRKTTSPPTRTRMAGRHGTTCCAGPGARPLLIGNGGFKGKFVADGTCEVGYSIMEGQQRRGYATEVVQALVAWAFSDPEIERVVAHTLPELTPSIRVLEKSGFTLSTETLEEGAIMFELKRRPLD